MVIGEESRAEGAAPDAEVDCMRAEGRAFQGQNPCPPLPFGPTPTPAAPSAGHSAWPNSARPQA
eukprot:9483450-Pyramimonas_sp.AAC.1